MLGRHRLTFCSSVFYFLVWDDEESFTCHYFNIRESGPQSTQSIITATVNPIAVAGSSSSVAPIVTTKTLTPDLTYQAPIRSASTPPQPSSNGIASTESRTTNDPSPSSSLRQEPGNGSLLESAKVGIGVGVGVGILCLGLGALLGLFIRRRRTPAHQPVPQDDNHAALYQPSSGGNASGVGKREYVASTYGELPTHERAQEMHGGRYPTQELPGLDR